MQFTISDSIEISGVGLHGGLEAKIHLHPAPVGTGVVFLRNGQRISALYDRVVVSPLCTMLAGDDGEFISTIEHLMAAIWVADIDNLFVEVSGEEIPILDGSALPFLEAIWSVGVVSQGVERHVLNIARLVEVRLGEAWARLTPASSFSAKVTIDFEDPAIGRQSCEFDGSAGMFMAEFAGARTFCQMSDVEMMRSQGKALGGTLENALVFENGRVLSPGGMRMEQEPVKHKMLDAVGDLALLGRRMNARFEAYRPGHKLTNMLLREGAMGCVFAEVPMLREYELCELEVA